MISDSIKRYKKLENLSNRPGRGQKNIIRSLKLIKKVREKICRNPRRLMKKLAKKYQVSEKTIQRIVKKDLHIFTFAIQKRQALTRLQKEKRKFRATKLLDEITSSLTGGIVWSDEKIFTVEQTHNRKNDLEKVF